jgi:WD40 repeat protein
MLNALIAAAVIAPGAVGQAAPAITHSVVAQSGPQVSRIKTFNHLRATEYAGSPRGSIFAVALEDMTVKIMDASKLRSTHTLTGHPRVVSALAFSPDGKILATGDGSARIWLWDVATGEKIREFPRERGHTRGISGLEFSPDGNRLASVGEDDIIHIWPVSGGHPKWTVKGNGANLMSADFSQGNGLFAATLAEGFRVYEPGGYTSIGAYNHGGGSQGVNVMVLNDRSTLGVTGGRDGFVGVWDLRNGRNRTARMKGHDGWIMDAAVAPNGTMVATSGNDMKVKLWDLKSYKEIAEIDEQSAMVSPLAFTGDGKYLVTANVYGGVQIHQITPPLR